MHFSQLEYLVALAKEGHFSRAAEEFHVSQPALSAGIRKLEAELDVQIVRRANRYEGLTAEGERLLDWARKILADRHALVEEIRTMRDGLSGKLSLGSIPTALPALSLLTGPLRASHPLDVDEALPGDLVFVRMSKRAWHVGIYLGDQRFIHAPSTGKAVVIERLDDGYYLRHRIQIRRLDALE